MTLTYGGVNLAGMAAKYGDTVVLRIVKGTNELDSIAGTHEKDDLAYKEDLVIKCRPLTGAQWHALRNLVSASVTTPYKKLYYLSGETLLYGDYTISVTQATNVLFTSERQLYGGAVITFEQR